MHKTLLRLFILFLCISATGIAQSQTPRTYRLSGKVMDDEGNALETVYVIINGGEQTLQTNEQGRFQVGLPQGQYTLDFRYLSKEVYTRRILLRKDQYLAVTLKGSAIDLEDVVIKTESTIDVNSVTMGTSTLDITTLKKLPTLLGEVDVIRSVTALPGVVNAGEGSAGFYVRGGSADQNLVLLDDAPVFNSAHLLGFFSVYNPDILSKYTLYRSGIFARYGSRISSILDVELKNGDSRKMNYYGGISPITARLGMDGPISKKTTIVLAGRAASLTYILKLFPNPDLNRSSTYFYDHNIKIKHSLSQKDDIEFSGYGSKDSFKFPFDTTYNWTNTLGSLKWKHIYADGLSSTVSVIKSIYDSNVVGLAPVEDFTLNSSIDFQQIKADFLFVGKERHVVEWGAGVGMYAINPGGLRCAARSRA